MHVRTYKYMYIHTSIHTYVRMHACTYYIHTYMHTYVHTYVHTADIHHIADIIGVKYLMAFYFSDVSCRICFPRKNSN